MGLCCMCPIRRMTEHEITGRMAYDRQSGSWQWAAVAGDLNYHGRPYMHAL